MKNYNNKLNFYNKIFGIFVPKHIKDPRLIIRMIRSNDPSAWFTILMFVFGVLAIPLDMIFSLFEQNLFNISIKSDLPIIIVCGVPRSGTTLVSQVLIKYLPVNYISNLTALFPRSPIIANKIFRKFIKQKITFLSYYGKTGHLSGPNDAFFIWDRWLKEDSSGVKCVLREEKKDEMVQFFGVFQDEFGKPLILKNNSLSTQAVLVAKALENTYFICMTRNPVFVAQSLIGARMEIQGNLSDSLWVNNPDKSSIQDGNYIEDVCDQVLYHEKKMIEQQKLIGKERFWIIPYEQFCDQPELLVKQVSEQIMGESIQSADLQKKLKPFSNSNKLKVELHVFEEIQKTLDRLKKAA